MPDTPLTHSKQRKKAHAPERLSEVLDQLFATVNQGTDFTVIVVATGYLDHCLATLLSRNFLEGGTEENLLNPSGGALGSFKARADLCYVLGLISKQQHFNLGRIAEVRNHAAHVPLEVDFGNPVISALVSALDPEIYAAVKIGFPTDSYMKALEHPRSRFATVAVFLASALLMTALGTPKRAPRADADWSPPKAT